MSDEIAQEDEDAEDYDLEALESRTRARNNDDDDDATLVGGRRGPSSVIGVGEDEVVFEIGEHDDEDEPKSAEGKKYTHTADDRQHGDDVERQGLMNDHSQRDRND